MTDDLALRAQEAWHCWKRDAPEYVAVDTETTGLAFYERPFCVTLAWVHGPDTPSFYWELDIGYYDDHLRTILNETPFLVFHNAKFDLQKLRLVDMLDEVDWRRIHDTEAVAHLLDEHQRLGLKPLAEENCGIPRDDEAAIKEWFRKHKIKKADWDYSLLPRDLLMPYAIKDTERTILLFEALWPQLTRQADLVALYDLERELTVALLDMEANGMAVDQAYLERTAQQLARKATELEIKIRRLTGNDEFNPNSWQQLQVALGERGFKDLPNTEAETLAALGDELADAVVELRGVRKIHGTYIINLLQEQKGGLVHPWFRQHGTRTGRMSSGGATA